MINKKIIFTLFAGILSLIALQTVSAYVSYDYYPRYGSEIYVSAHSPDYEDYGYHYYGPDNYNYDNRHYYGDTYGNYYRRGYDYDRACKYWDDGQLRWKTDRVCQWIENGDGWREETQRYRAVVWQANSYDARYNIHAGRLSGEASYYHYRDKSETKPSDWRYKHAFDPRIDNEYVMGSGYYYYQPRYDSKTETYNWRF